MVIPLAVSGEVVGSPSVHFTRENAFDGEIRRQLGGVATRMSVALERARNLSRLRLQGIALTSAPNAIIIADRQGRIEWANESFCRKSGQALEELIGQAAPFLCEREPGQWRCSAIRQPESATETWRGELVQCHADGRTSIVEQIITTLRGPRGEIIHFVTVQEDITARKESERRIEHLAHHDALTGLANRVVFQDSLARALEQARRGGRMLALLLLDLDRFKLVNDSLGHAAGDLLLQGVADRLRSHVRGADLVARLGGDEFAIVQADPEGTEGAATLARRILDALDRPIVLNGREIHTTASIGITVFPGDFADGEQFVKNADLAMYRAKALGRNTYQFYSERMHAEVQARLTLENALRGALARQELVLHYQPQADLGSRAGRITSVEALLRWQHPERGLVPPGEFIPVAEDSGLIVALGRWALRRACADCRTWRESGLPPLSVDVNMSSEQFHRDDIVAAVTEALAETGLAADCLGLEVTESLLATDIRATAEALHRLRRLGVRLSIDDFGTGYSSLSYLGHFPFDRLKIDKAFVEGVTSDPNDLAIIRAIISLGHALGMRVLAEGVETPDQRRCLAEMQCDEIQGRLISRPLPAERLVEFLRDRGARATPAGRSGSMSGDWRPSISHRATPRLYSFE
jgi:diguanylate cyclase (GGDEF)-like protein/PAS domain S-box-containing protein